MGRGSAFGHTPPDLPEAECVEAPAVLFDLEATPAAHWTARREFCDRCRVQAECLAYAIKHREEGIWGGHRLKGGRAYRVRPPYDSGEIREKDHGTVDAPGAGR